MAFVLLGCRAKVEAHVSGGNLDKNHATATEETQAESPAQEDKSSTVTDPSPSSPPAEESVDGGIKTIRTHYQTRNVIELAPAEALAAEDGAFTVSDSVSGAIIAADVWSEPAFETEDGYRYATAGGRALFLYPLAPVMQSRLTYGESVWKLTLQDPSAPKSSTVTIVRRDFDIMGRQGMSSGVGMQSTHGFQGGVGFRGGRSFSPDGGHLTSGVVGIVNQ